MSVQAVTGFTIPHEPQRFAQSRRHEAEVAYNLPASVADVGTLHPSPIGPPTPVSGGAGQTQPPTNTGNSNSGWAANSRPRSVYFPRKPPEPSGIERAVSARSSGLRRIGGRSLLSPGFGRGFFVRGECVQGPRGVR